MGVKSYQSQLMFEVVNSRAPGINNAVLSGNNAN
jgi:hypothetical protein